MNAKEKGAVRKKPRSKPKMDQEKLDKIIDIAIDLHKEALKELERH